MQQQWKKNIVIWMSYNLAIQLPHEKEKLGPLISAICVVSS